MSKIHILDEHLANQIAAGEVVERPVSVVKELVENSLDAGANSLRIEIQQWGIASIYVKDDGEWISKEDISLATKKYATSKISSLQDLQNVMSFGFRWEALASIVSVSDVTLASVQNWQVRAYEVVYENGQEISFQETSLSSGTSIRVENLFQNTPARLNYLKKPKTEYSHIYTYIQKMALAHPEVGFEFISDGTTICQFRSWETLSDRIYGIYGDEVSHALLPIEFVYNGLELFWYISDPKIFFPNKNRQTLLVNSRNISSWLISKALFDAYNRFIPPKNHPAYVLNLSVDPTQIDVNVHPRKQEIRFAQEQSIFRAFYHWVRETLEKVSLASSPIETSDWKKTMSTISSSTQNSPQTPSNTPKYYTGSGTKFKSYSPYKNTTANPQQSQIDNALEFSREILQDRDNVNTDISYTPLGKIIGQTHNSYIIVETPTGIKILDQHALAERVIYEKLSKNAYTPEVQQLLIPENISLTPQEKDTVQEHIQTLTEMGFTLEILSGNRLMIQAIPEFIQKENLEEVFLGVLQDIETTGRSSKTLEEVRHKIWAYMACRSAIKFWDRLSIFEISKLLSDASLDYSATCPHGRPVVWEMDLEEMKKKYER